MDSIIPLGQKNTLAEYMILSGFDVPIFSPGDDLIAYLNKAMAFLIAVASSSFGGNNASGQERVVKCYNYQGEGHMARQCTQPKLPRNATWYKEKAMLAKAQETGQILDEERLTFLADLGVPDAVFMDNISNYGSEIISEVPHSETYLNDMENQSVHAMQDFEQSPVLIFQRMRYIAQQDSMILFVIEQISEQMTNHVNNGEKANKEQNNESIDSQMGDMIKEKLALKEQVHSLEQNLSKQIKEKECYQNPFYLKKAQQIKPTLYDGIVMSAKHVAMPVIDDEETLILEEESRSKMSEKEKDPKAIKQNISYKPIDYEKLNRLSDDFGKCFTPQQELSAEQAFWLRMSNPTSKPSDALPIKIKTPKELPKISLVNESLKMLKFHLAKFHNMVKIRTTPNAHTEGEWGFEHTKAIFNNEIIPFLKSLKDIFNVFDKDLLNEIMEVQTVLTKWTLLFNSLQLTNNV
ncbi:hypothetical protein Tco_0046185 [Tanacetum coccineum]